MRAVHRASGQSTAALSSLLLAACTSTPEGTIWPPPDFELVVEETREGGEHGAPLRRFRVRADGVVFFATSSATVRDAEGEVVLPVYDRLCVYQLVPTSTRALARRIHRTGVLELESMQGERGTADATNVTLRWRAFEQTKVVTAQGRVHGEMALILAIVGAHLPDGEYFELPGIDERAIASVLRGVPAPLADAQAALDALLQLAERAPQDGTLLLDAFALACHVARRDVAQQLLDRWAEATDAERRARAPFPEGEPALTKAALERLLPAG